jgi:hypothetical protein
MKAPSIAPASLGNWLAGNEFSVPKYQRAYTWKKEHVQNMLTDIASAIKRKKANKGDTYFMGAIVVVNRAGQVALEVVDGQQRLATISIILAAIRDYHWNTSQTRAAERYDQYLRTLHVPSNKFRPRLRLNALDNPCFANAIVEEPKKRKKQAKWTIQSHKRLIEAYDLAVAFVDSIANTNTPKDTIDILFEMVEFIRSNVQVIHVGVDDEVDAFTIFETLNDRHLSLTIADLLKNFLFGASGESIGETQTHWDTMAGALRGIRGKKDRTVDFIRQLWGSHHGLVREKELFRDIKQKIVDEESAKELAVNLAEQAPHYVAVTNPTDDVWAPYGDSALSALLTFNTLRVERIRPILLAILDRFSKKEVAKSLRFLKSSAVRIVLTTGINGTVEETIYSIAVKIHEKEIRNAAQLAKAAADIVHNDAIFQAHVATMRVSNGKLARFLLAAIEDYAKGEDDPDHEITRDTGKVNLEHIIPDAASERAIHWPELTAEEGESLANRLGNLTLLPYKKNSNLNGLDFPAKKAVYASCEGIYITKAIADKYNTWGEKEVNQRQADLAKVAVKVWPLNFDD